LANAPASPSEELGEEDLRRIMAAYQQYQAEAEAINQHLGLFQVSIEGCDKALTTIKAMGSAEDDQEILVPIGAGSFIHAKMASKDKVILGVGADVNIEKDVTGAKTSLEARRTQLVEGSSKLNETLNKIAQEMGKIESIITRYEEGAAARSGNVVQ